MRSSSEKVNEILEAQIVNLLIQTIADIKDQNTSKLFLYDFLSEAEIQLLSKRLAIAYWLKKGRSYENIKQNLKVSSATIASVQKQMSNKGFKWAIKNLEAEEWANKWHERFRKITNKPGMSS